jgi:hypothetical protein
MGNYISGTLNGHPVVDSDIFAVNVLFIVQGGVFYGHTANYEIGRAHV